MVNLLSLGERELVATACPCATSRRAGHILFATKAGQKVKKTELEAFSHPRAAAPGDRLEDADQVMTARRTVRPPRGHDREQARHYHPVSERVRPMAGTPPPCGGDRGPTRATRSSPPSCRKGHDPDCHERGFGKRTPLGRVPSASRAGKGIIDIQDRRPNGTSSPCCSCTTATYPGRHDQGQMIRFHAADVSRRDAIPGRLRITISRWTTASAPSPASTRAPRRRRS